MFPLFTINIPKIIIIRETKTFHVICSSRTRYPNIIPKMGIKYATWVWNTNPLTVKILNLINKNLPHEDITIDISINEKFKIKHAIKKLKIPFFILIYNYIL